MSKRFRKDCHTQTSKTVVQLALLDLARSEDRQIGVEKLVQKNNVQSIIDDVDSSKKRKSLLDTCSTRLELNLNENDYDTDGLGEPKMCRNVFPFSRFTINKIHVKAISDNGNDRKDLDYSVASTSTFLNETSGRCDENKDKAAKLYGFEKMNCANLAQCDPVLSVAKDVFHGLLTRIKNDDWDISLKALIELADLSNILDHEKLYTHMPEINQKLISFLRSPRSNVCSTSCQVAGRLFETVKDTRRPEFDEIVDVLLSRTADYNKFIRERANLALDSMILHISPFYTVRAVSQKGPDHKNDLVRITSARLFACVVLVSGASLFLSPTSNEFTRKRILTHMVNFTRDKNPTVRAFGKRIYDELKNHPNFEAYLKKVAGRNDRLLDFFKTR